MINNKKWNYKQTKSLCRKIGVTPSGILTMGHLAGALSNWVKLQDKFECYFMIADLHAITVRQNPAELKTYFKKQLLCL
ncbi:hypothetical protein MASR1M45_31740 [Candidatus Kapaibacterium sp.]